MQKSLAHKTGFRKYESPETVICNTDMENDFLATSPGGGFYAYIDDWGNGDDLWGDAE